MKLLLVEDNPADVRLVREMLRDVPAGDFQLQHSDRLGSALDRLRGESFDEVLLDLGLPDSQGMQTLALTQKVNEHTPIVVLTNRDDESFAAQAVRAGAQDYLVKGRFSGESLAQTIRYAFERKRAQDEIHRLNAELEQRVRERTAEIETVNRELETFAYSVSHDLRAPLRSIDGFSRILLRDQSAALNERGQEYLQRIRAASQRMAALIDDLLELSRTARSEFRRAPLDLAEFARPIASELSASEPARCVTWHIAPALPARGDSGLLRAALENLLGNAWKFTARQPEARIEFSAAEQNGERVFCVRDNGAGFDMRYADKLFGAFQRLHSPDEFPGTGIGLATVQRIIHRHGGRVWAESEVGAGARFYFTLPDEARRT